MNITEKIERLRQTNSKNEIKNMLLTEQLSEIFTYGGRHHIRGYALSHLITEVYHPGFLKYNTEHPGKLAVHHRNGNPLDDRPENLKVLRLDHHSKMHALRYQIDPKNKEALENKSQKISDHWSNSANKEAKERRNQKAADTNRKNRSWGPKQARKFFSKWFTTKEYAKFDEVSYNIASWRLNTLIAEGEIIRKSKVVEHERFVFRTSQQI